MAKTAQNMDPIEASGCANVAWSLSSKFAWKMPFSDQPNNKHTAHIGTYMDHKMHLTLS